MGLVRWLRETASRQVPQWLLYIGVFVALGLMVLSQSILRFDLLQAMAFGLVVGVAIAYVGKLIWAAANPLSDSDDLADD
jgi:hypothetical protein